MNSVELDFAAPKDGVHIHERGVNDGPFGKINAKWNLRSVHKYATMVK